MLTMSTMFLASYLTMFV